MWSRILGLLLGHRKDESICRIWELRDDKECGANEETTASEERKQRTRVVRLAFATGAVVIVVAVAVAENMFSELN